VSILLGIAKIHYTTFFYQIPANTTYYTPLSADFKCFRNFFLTFSGGCIS